MHHLSAYAVVWQRSCRVPTCLSSVPATHPNMFKPLPQPLPPAPLSVSLSLPSAPSLQSPLPSYVPLSWPSWVTYC